MHLWSQIYSIILTMLEDILKIYIPCSDVNDKRVWPFTKDGSLSTTLAYKILSQPTNNRNNDMINWKQIWKSPLPQRILLLSWKCLILVRKLLGTKTNLCSTICPNCESEEEIMAHDLFFFCDHARVVWLESNFGYLSHFDKKY